MVLKPDLLLDCVIGRGFLGPFFVTWISGLIYLVMRILSFDMRGGAHRRFFYSRLPDTRRSRWLSSFEAASRGLHWLLAQRKVNQAPRALTAWSAFRYKLPDPVTFTGWQGGRFLGTF